MNLFMLKISISFKINGTCNWKSEIFTMGNRSGHWASLKHRCWQKKITTELCDKRNDFNFVIVNFTYTCINIPLSPVYGVYISQLIQYAKPCSTYDQFLSLGRILTDKFALQGFLQSRLMSAFRKFFGRYNGLIYNYELSLSHMLSDIFHTNS
jgi:hypothetical protein